MDAATRAKVEALQRRRKATKNIRVRPVSKEMAAAADQAAAFKKLGMMPLTIDKARIFTGEKCVEVAGGQITGNPHTNVWAVKGNEVVRDTAAVNAETYSPKQMEELLKVLMANQGPMPPAGGPEGAEAPEGEHQHEEADSAPAGASADAPADTDKPAEPAEPAAPAEPDEVE